jgi:hypothetical protein
VKLDMALPFRRFTRLASAPHLRFQSIIPVRKKDDEFAVESPMLREIAWATALLLR